LLYPAIERDCNGWNVPLIIPYLVNANIENNYILPERKIVMAGMCP